MVTSQCDDLGHKNFEKNKNKKIMAFKITKYTIFSIRALREDFLVQIKPLMF